MHAPLAFDATGQSVLLTLGGIKSPYSDGFFTPAESAAADQMDRCEALKARCDPGCRLLRLHEKCVLRQ